MALVFAIAALALSPSLGGSANPLSAAASFCADAKAFGVPFGSREVRGQHLSVTSRLLQLPARYRPFGSAEVVGSLRERRTHTVHGQADFDSGGQAERALKTIEAALIASGWQRSGSDAAPTSLLYSDQKASDPEKPKGRIAELFTLGTRLYFSCSDAALKRDAERQMPPMPRPVASNTAQ